jgi:hypothetical protein
MILQKYYSLMSVAMCDNSTGWMSDFVKAMNEVDKN